MHDSVLYRVVTMNSEPVHQLLLPDVLKKEVLHALHDDTGHQGMDRTLSLVQSRCYWPSMSADVQQYVKFCERCLVSKIKSPKLKCKMGHLIGSRPNDLVCIVDFSLMNES